jgi:hypothetical protein
MLPYLITLITRRVNPKLMINLLSPRSYGKYKALCLERLEEAAICPSTIIN